MRSTGSTRILVRAIGRGIAIAASLAALTPAMAAALFVVNQPWVRPAAVAGSADAYMILRSSEGTTLVGVRSEQAAVATIDIPSDTAHRGKFRSVARLPLPAGETVEFAPDRVHVHLASVKRALKLGEHVALVLVLEATDGTTQEITINAEVRRHSPVEDEGHAHGHPAPRTTAH